MSLRKKIIFPVAVLIAAFVLSGCGQEEKTVPGPEANKGIFSEQQKPDPEKMPEPTGEVDDAVGAALEGADAEEAQIFKEEEDAMSSLDDSEETNNFYESYDENEF